MVLQRVAQFTFTRVCFTQQDHAAGTGISDTACHLPPVSGTWVGMGQRQQEEIQALLWEAVFETWQGPSLTVCFQGTEISRHATF